MKWFDSVELWSDAVFVCFTFLFQRAPLTARERVEAERLRKEKQDVEHLSKPVDENVDFYREFDTWVDSQWPDKQVATKIKVGFRKEHRKIVQELCLDDVQDIAKAL